jgi:hypothetical protein
MKRTFVTIAVLSLLAMLSAQFAWSDETTSVAGKCDITIKMGSQRVSEEWTILQDGDLVKAKVKSSGGELEITGEVNGTIFRSDFKDKNGVGNKVRAGILDDRMDGSLTIGSKEYFWSAKRVKP